MQSGSLRDFLPSSFGSAKSKKKKGGGAVGQKRAREPPQAIPAEDGGEGDALRAFMPKSFGSSKHTRKRVKRAQPIAMHGGGKKTDDDEGSGERATMVGPPAPPVGPSAPQGESTVGPMPPPAAAASEADATGSGSGEGNEEVDLETIPVQEAITALALDPAGGRLLSGGADYLLKMWDFASMRAGIRSFREFEPVEGNPITSLEYNSTGSCFLLACHNTRARLYSRDGHLTTEYKKGDPYLLDMTNTNNHVMTSLHHSHEDCRGHVAAICKATWDPVEKNHFWTASLDSTVRYVVEASREQRAHSFQEHHRSNGVRAKQGAVLTNLRLWDADNEKSQVKIIKARNANNTRVGILAMNISGDGKTIAAACQDGSLQLWPAKGPYARPRQVVRTAHVNGSDTSCVRFSPDGSTLATRGGDDTLKMWDLRSMGSPLAVFEGLENYFSTTDCIFSPAGSLLMTGTSVRKGSGDSGKLMVYSAKTCRPVEELDVCPGSIVRLLWHEDLNQLMIGSSDANIYCCYDPYTSVKGIKFSKEKIKKKHDDVFDFDAPKPIHLPNSLDMFKAGPSKRRAAEKARMDPKKSRKPDLPVQGPGHGGRVSTVSNNMMKGMKKIEPLADDPREALLKYAKEAEENPFWFKTYQGGKG